MSAGIAVGDDATVVFGITGDASAPPGRVGFTELPGLQVPNGGPHKLGLPENDVAGKPERGPGISPVNKFPDALKSCKFGRFKSEIEPANEFSSIRNVSKCVNRFKTSGILPEKLLCDTSRRYSFDSEDNVAGKLPEKRLWEIKRSLRLVRLDRSGI